MEASMFQTIMLSLGATLYLWGGVQRSKTTKNFGIVILVLTLLAIVL